MEPVCAFSVPPEQDPRHLGEVQAGPALVQSVAHKNKYKYKLALVQSVARPDESSVQCAEELGHRLSTFRGTESNLFCTYCRFYNALPPFLASRCSWLECSSLKLPSF